MTLVGISNYSSHQKSNLTVLDKLTLKTLIYVSRDGLGRVRDPTCPIPPGRQHCTWPTTGNESFPDPCSCRPGNVSLPVTSGVQRQFPSRIRQLGFRTYQSPFLYVSYKIKKNTNVMYRYEHGLTELFVTPISLLLMLPALA